MVKPIPDGYHSITPFLIVKNGAQAIQFYKDAFQAKEISRFDGPNGKVMHAELKIGDSLFMLADEYPDKEGFGMTAPNKSQGVPVGLNLYVNDVDTVFTRAVQKGAKSIKPVENMFWGDRYGQIEDPFGHRWSISTHIEDLTPEEIKQRAMQMFAGKPTHK